jgi:hypothetical protein
MYMLINVHIYMQMCLYIFTYFLQLIIVIMCISTGANGLPVPQAKYVCQQSGFLANYDYGIYICIHTYV